MPRNAFVSLLAVVLALMAQACSPRGYRFADSERYLREPGVGKKYKTAAVLYVGYTSASPMLQAEGGHLSDSSIPASAIDAEDVVRYSNALIDALSRSGINIVERTRVNELVREQGLVNNELVDLSDLEKVQRLGKLLKADLLIKGSVFTEWGGFRFTSKAKVYHVILTGLAVRAVDANTGQIVWSDVTIVASRSVPRQIEENQQISDYSVINEMVAKMVQGLFG